MYNDRLCVKNPFFSGLLNYSFHYAVLNISAGSVSSHSSTAYVFLNRSFGLVGMPVFRLLLCCGPWVKPGIYGRSFCPEQDVL
jgi:hypothetical protein